MKDELEDKITKAFPSVYPGYNPRYPISRDNRRFSFECGDGWFQLLWDLSAKLEPICTRINLLQLAGGLIDGEEPRFAKASQVKEKFGTLRFYMDFHNQDMDGPIAEAEARSEVTCEECGKPGLLREGGWIKTLCDEHAEGRLARKSTE